MLLIENTDEQFWDGDQFGPVQNACRFKVVDDLPLIISSNHGDELYLQELESELPIYCYADGDRIEAFVMPDDNLCHVSNSGVNCPKCGDVDMIAYVTGKGSKRVCPVCMHSEGM